MGTINKNAKINILIVILITITIRGIGFENLPFELVILLSILCAGYFLWSIFNVNAGKDKKIFGVRIGNNIKKEEQIYYRVFAFCISICAIVVAVAYAIDVKNPTYSAQIRPIILPLMIIMYVATVLSVFIWTIMRINRNKKKK